MADWSQLPPELLTLIAKRLEARFDVLRFRSVCSSWRSSFPPKVYPLPQWFPSKNKGMCEFALGHITINTFYLVRLPGANPTATACWLVNIRDGTELLKPLSDSELKPLPAIFPKVLDLTNFQVIELGHQIFGQYSVYIDHPLEPSSSEYRKKVAIMWSSTNSNDFMLLAVFHHAVPYVAFCRSGQITSTLLERVKCVQDIISFNGKFYAIEEKGRTIVIDQSLKVSFLEHVGSPSSRRFLVQSGDNLLAVEMFYPTSSVSDDETESPDSFGSHSVGFRIFRLDEEEQKWDEMESLGDQILFLGLSQAISTSASEFYWGKGNLIFYSRGLSIPPGHRKSQDSRMFVFDLKTGTATSINNCPAYCNLFWLPPEGLTSPKSVISSREVGAKSPGRVTSAGQEEVGSKPPYPSSKCSFKFCCF